MELADEDDPLVKVTWHIERSLLRWLTGQSRETGVPRAAIARRLLAEGMVRQVTGGTASPGMILPPVTEAVPWVEGVTVTAGGGGTDVRPAVRVPTEDGAKLVDQGSGEVLAVEKAKRPPRQTTAEELGMDPGAVAEKLEPDHVAMVGGRPWVPSKDQPKRPKVQHHDDVVIGGGALVKCRRCTLVKNAARPEVCDG